MKDIMHLVGRALRTCKVDCTVPARSEIAPYLLQGIKTHNQGGP